MPASRITTNFLLGAQKDHFLADYHQVLRDTLSIMEHDRLVILDERTDDFFTPTNTSGNYVFIEISLFPGRTVEIKRSLYAALVDLCENYAVPRTNMRIALYESEKANWGIRGGQAGCDVDYQP